MSTLAEAQIMATKVDLHASQGSRHDRSAGNGFGGQKTKIGDKNKRKGHVGMFERDSSSEGVAFLLVEKKRLEGLQKKEKEAKKMRQQQKKENQEKHL